MEIDIEWNNFTDKRPDLHINQTTGEGVSDRLLLSINHRLYIGHYILTMVENPDTNEHNIPVYSFEVGIHSLITLNDYDAPINADGQLIEDNFDECSIYWAYTSSIQGGIP